MVKTQHVGYAIGENITFYGNSLVEIKRNLAVEGLSALGLWIQAASYTVDCAGNYIDLYVSEFLPRREITFGGEVIQPKQTFQWVKITGMRTKHLPHPHRAKGNI